MPSGKLCKKGKEIYITYDLKTKQTGKTVTEQIKITFHPQEIQRTDLLRNFQGKYPGAKADVEVAINFELAPKKFDKVKLETLAFPQPTITTTTPTILSLTKHTEHNQQFYQITDESGLSKLEKQNTILEIIKEKNLNSSEVKILLTACSQNFPLMFSSLEKFKEALLRLVNVSGTAKYLNSYSSLATSLPPCILIHGSSVGGVRHRKKDNRGWAFDDDSDIDVSIVDGERFLWSQLLGITTYDNCNTIELSDVHIKLLKLTQFVHFFRQLTGRYPANFAIYRREQDARRHSGFSLVCKYDMSQQDFTIEKIYVKATETGSEITKEPETLKKYFSCNEKMLIIEKWANVTAMEEKFKKVVNPEQGNHAFNDVHDYFDTHMKKLQELFGGREYDEATTGFLFLYMQTLIEVSKELEFTSRREALAEKHHAKNRVHIQTGRAEDSNAINDFLYGNACAYFSNCSYLICKLVIEYSGSPCQVRTLYYPIRKAFSTLLDCIIDERLIENLKNDDGARYIKTVNSNYKTTNKNAIKVVFKTGLDGAFKVLPGIAELIHMGNVQPMKTLLYSLGDVEDGSDLGNFERLTYFA